MFGGGRRKLVGPLVKARAQHRSTMGSLLSQVRLQRTTTVKVDELTLAGGREEAI